MILSLSHSKVLPFGTENWQRILLRIDLEFMRKIFLGNIYFDGFKKATPDNGFSIVSGIKAGN